MINMRNGSVVMELEMVKSVFDYIEQELKHWKGCKTCSKSTTIASQLHRTVRLAKPLMSS